MIYNLCTDCVYSTFIYLQNSFFKIINLFSIFDPNTIFLIYSIEINWLRIPISFIYVRSSFWLLCPPFMKIFKSLILFLEKEIQLNFSASVNPGITHLIISIFFFIVINNYLGLSPYVFTATRHLRITLSLALSFWLSYFLWLIIKNFRFLLSHLVPLGTPYLLIPLIVLIELTRNIIRPITLSVRLAANIVAGHLLLTLIASPISPISQSIFIFLLSCVILAIMLLENAVAIIQAYVFSILSSLYLAEANTTTNYLNNFLVKP